jgi:hypothetical protein
MPLGPIRARPSCTVHVAHYYPRAAARAHSSPLPQLCGLAARLGAVRAAAQHVRAVARHVCSAAATSPTQEGWLRWRECGTELTGSVERGRRWGVDDIDGEAWTALGHARICGDLHGKTEERWDGEGDGGREVSAAGSAWERGSAEHLPMLRQRRRRRRRTLGHARSEAERRRLRTWLSGRRGSDRGAVGRRLYGVGTVAGVGTWHRCWNGVLTGGPSAEREADRWDPAAAIFFWIKNTSWWK